MENSSSIFRVVRVGDLTELLNILKNHPELDINLRNEDNETMLICCVKCLERKWMLPFGGEFTAMCEMLLEQNIDVNLKDHTGNTALHYAVELQLFEISKLLIKNGARFDICGKDGVSALDLVVKSGDIDWVRYICEVSSIKIHCGAKLERWLFHKFLSTKHTSCVKWLCQHYPEIIDEKDESSLTAVHVSVVKNNVRTLKILLDIGASIEAVDNEGRTALHFAVVYGHDECLAHLLEYGAEVNCQDIYGATPLHYAIHVTSNHSQSNDEENFNGNIAFMESLLNCGASVILADNDGRVPLHWAANTDDANACEMMVSRGCPVNVASSEGLTALHIAAGKGHAECVRVLVVNCSADVNITDEAGNSPLVYAIIKGHIDCAELLMYDGALPNKCNLEGNSPAHYAATKGLTSALEILHKYEGSLELENTDGNRPLHNAAFHERLDAVDYMLKCKGRVNVRNKKGLTALHLAASAGSTAVCDRLLRGGASVNVLQIQCKNGVYKFLTAADIARLNKRSECVQFLNNAGGIRGQRIADVAARKIQKCWKRKHKLFKLPEYANKEEHKMTNFELGAETENENDKAENENTAKINTASDKVKNDTSETKKQDVGEDPSDHEEKVVNTVTQGSGTVKDFSELEEDSVDTKFDTHCGKPVEEKSEASCESFKFDEERRNVTSKSPVTTVKKDFTSSATDSFSGDIHNFLVLENPADKGTRSEEHCELIRKSSNEKRKKIPPSGIYKMKSGGLQGVQRCPPTNKPSEKEKKTLRSTKRGNSMLRQAIDNVITCSSSHGVGGVRLENPKNRPMQPSQSLKEERRSVERNLKASLDAEISRTEKLSKEIARVKKSLDQRSHSLEQRLKEVELKLRWT